MSANPYQTPVSVDPSTGLMSLRTVRFVILTGIAGLLAGGALGVVVALMAPEYYRGLFNSGGNAGFDERKMGLALGAAQGFGGGVAVGVVLAIADAWLKLKHRHLG